MEGCECDNMKMISSAPNTGLGQFDIVTGIFDFASGLFGKDPQKTEYDNVRQQAWDSLENLVAVHDEHKAAGTLSRSFVQKLIDTLTQLMAGFKKYTDSMLSKYPDDSGWITPRFNDYYNFMAGIKTAWQQELATLPVDWSAGGVIDYVQDIFTGGEPVVNIPQFPNSPTLDPFTSRPMVQERAGMDTTSMLLVGGAILGLIIMSRKRG